MVEEERSHPTILKRFKEVAATKPGEPVDPLVPLRSALNAARRLESLLQQGEASFPSGLAEQAGGIAAALEETLGDAQAQAEPAD